MRLWHLIFCQIKNSAQIAGIAAANMHIFYYSGTDINDPSMDLKVSALTPRVLYYGSFAQVEYLLYNIKLNEALCARFIVSNQIQLM